MSATTAAVQPASKSTDGHPTADELAAEVRSLLDRQRIDQARRTAASAAKAHPQHPWLTQADRILNPTRMVTRPARGKGRELEFAWLRENAAAHRKHWVALLGDRLLASGETFAEVQRVLESLQLDEKPLLHYVE